ncbi:hypothetical protein SPSIL_053270 [Sporomusa silvacetica DSM 10669]|uniref:Uncharacterized protein n=1 Tax=Sporomusa silvacetica DSM 10669 TaxID=1123289 RepID=A0ABZ3IUD5_9FIRM|nr:hypothetical protein SPSIL_20120 [Sporomusa silvacetica DSM 10669]
MPSVRRLLLFKEMWKVIPLGVNLEEYLEES